MSGRLRTTPRLLKRNGEASLRPRRPAPAWARGPMDKVGPPLSRLVQPGIVGASRLLLQIGHVPVPQTHGSRPGNRPLRRSLFARAFHAPQVRYPPLRPARNQMGLLVLAMGTRKHFQQFGVISHPKTPHLYVGGPRQECPKATLRKRAPNGAGRAWPASAVPLLLQSAARVTPLFPASPPARNASRMRESARRAAVENHSGENSACPAWPAGATARRARRRGIL